jgi:hypothetical protein
MFIIHYRAHSEYHDLLRGNEMSKNVLRRKIVIAAGITSFALGFRLFLGLHLPNDDDDDGKFYAQIARNLLDHRGYSGEEEEPYVPTYVRVPGYPLFLAGIFRVFGRDNQTAVRIVQAIVDTITCWVVALLAFAWTPLEWELEKRRRALLIALALAAACPFTAVYTSTILTESWAMLLATSFVLVATHAFKNDGLKKLATLWLAAGVLGGLATMFRPDCAIFTGGVGVLLLSRGLVKIVQRTRDRRRTQQVVATLAGCAALAVGFAITLTPWTIRNARVFGILQPVAPAYANMPDEFAPLGYIAWLRTWVDDEKYVGPIEDSLDLYPIPVDKIPDYAFDTAEERERVLSLLDRYNNPPKHNSDLSSEDDEEPDQPAINMTPEIDVGFAELARERIARNPLRYSIALPVRRAVSMWFDTHSQYYPFQGEIFPVSDIDTNAHQQYWLLLFAGLTWFYTIVGAIGLSMMMRSTLSQLWGILLILLILPRLAFLAAQEHPESRYTVEFFPFVAAAGGLALAALTRSAFRGEKFAAWIKSRYKRLTAAWRRSTHE